MNAFGFVNEAHLRQFATIMHGRSWRGETTGNIVSPNSTVGVVGCGGTGSHVALQLAHLGVGRLVLVDHDVVEQSNLSRLVGVGAAWLGKPKVEAIAALVRQVSSEIAVSEVVSSVLDVETSVLAQCDIIVVATDGHGSRAWLTEFAEQYLISLVDLGVEIQTGERMHAGGGVRVVSPGSGCLQCAGTLSSALVREEYLSSADRELERRRGYLRGDGAPTPSVVALNGVVASLAVLEVCELLTGLLGTPARRLLYRAERRALTTTSIERQEWCYVCGVGGLTGRGDGRFYPVVVALRHEGVVYRVRHAESPFAGRCRAGSPVACGGCASTGRSRRRWTVGRGRTACRDRVREIEAARREAEQRSRDVLVDS